MFLNVLIFLLTLVPLASIFLSSGDMWDGVLMSHSAEIGVHDGVRQTFIESNYFAQFLLFKVVAELGKWLRFEYYSINKVILITIFLCIFQLLRQLSKIIVSPMQDSGKVAVLIFASLPIWSVTLSSVVTFHVLALLVGLAGVVLAHNRNGLYKSIGFIACIFSYTINSMLVFLPCLSLAIDNSINEGERHRLIKISWITIYILLSAIAYFMAFRSYHPPYGLYENYNNFIQLSTQGFFDFIYAFLRTSTLVIPLFIGFTYTFFSERRNNPFRFLYFRSRLLTIKHLCLLILIGASIFPYAAVGKYTSIWEIYDWSGRHAFLLAVSASIYTAYIFTEFSNGPGTPKRMRNILVLLVLPLVIYFPFVAYSYALKENRLIFDKVMVKELNRELGSQVLRTNMILQVKISGDVPKPLPRYYEWQHMLYRATGTTLVWWDGDADLESPSSLRCIAIKAKHGAPRFIYEPNPDLPYVLQRGTLKISGFDGPTNTFMNVLKGGSGNVTLSFQKPSEIRPPKCNLD